jgi:predicted metalloprotease
MRWQDERRSTNVEDRRGFPVRGAGVVGGGAILVALVATLLGAPPGLVRAILGGGGDDQTTETQTTPPSADDSERVDFVRAVLGSTEDVWAAVLPKSGQTYVPPKLVLFSDAVESACGVAGAAVGPFYCPPDRQVYLDLSFLRQLSTRFGAPGDFAQAYVIGHEVGHHVQNLLGISRRVQSQRAAAGSRAESNRLSVETELQADCLAGVWAYHANQTHHVLEPGDVEGALHAAAAIGDDTLQRETQGRVVPDSFTHGTSAQRVRWLRTGLERGRVEDCDTFNAESLGVR